MRLPRNIERTLPGFALLMLLCSCGDPVLHGSDASIVEMFRRHQRQLGDLVQMARQDKAEVLWLMTHESQPSDTILPEERWLAYDAVIRDTGVRNLYVTDHGIELDLRFASDDFMKEGMVKGLLFSQRPAVPLVASLDEGVPPELLQTGTLAAYKRLTPEWYLFVRQQ